MRFYDWFHERFASRCTHQCEKFACKPICLYHEQKQAIEQGEAELMVQDQAVYASQQRPRMEIARSVHSTRRI